MMRSLARRIQRLQIVHAGKVLPRQTISEDSGTMIQQSTDTDAVSNSESVEKNGVNNAVGKARSKEYRRNDERVDTYFETDENNKIKATTVFGGEILTHQDNIRKHSSNPSTLSKASWTTVETATASVPSSEEKIVRNEEIKDQLLKVESRKDAEAVMKRLYEIKEEYGSSEDLIFACDTEVRNIDIQKESPYGHGDVICFSIYAGKEIDFRPDPIDGPKATYLWVDTIKSENENDPETLAIVEVFKKFFEDESFHKVWHNYGFDRHVLKNKGIDCKGFAGDTMHMARLWNSSRKLKGYSLESLSQAKELDLSTNSAKTDMKKIFGYQKTKIDGSLCKKIVVPEIEELHSKDTYRSRWIEYSVQDAKSTYDLYHALKMELQKKAKNACEMESAIKDSYPSISTLWHFYQEVWRPFGELLTEMEQTGFYVDNEHLRKQQELAESDKEEACQRFRTWAESKVPDAAFMNVSSDTQIRTLLFAGVENQKKVELERIIKVPVKEDPEENEKSKKKKRRAKKFEKKKLHGLWGEGQKSPLEPKVLTVSGLPAVSSAALKALVGKLGAARKLLNESGLDADDNVFADLVIEDDEEVKEEERVSEKEEKTNEASSEEKEDALCRNMTATEYGLGPLYLAFPNHKEGLQACVAVEGLIEAGAIDALLSSFILPLQGSSIKTEDGRIHGSMNINTETGRLSCRRPNLQNQPALEKDRYQTRKAFMAQQKEGEEERTLVVADYGQLELRILAHLTNCESMIRAFKEGGDFHSRTAVGMYDYIKEAIANREVALEKGMHEQDIPLVKDIYASERRRAKVLNFSIAYGKTAHGLSKDFGVKLKEAKETLQRWYSDRKEVKLWQERTIKDGKKVGYVTTLLGRRRHLPELNSTVWKLKGHAERAAINTPIQGSGADIVTAAMICIRKNKKLRSLGWTLLSQVHDEVILEGPKKSAEEAKNLVIKCMAEPFPNPSSAGGDDDDRYHNPLRISLSVDAKSADTWYDAK